MGYVAGAIAGLILGGAAGQLKNFFLWKKYLRDSVSATAQPNELAGLYARSLISYIVNILTLAAAFFMRTIFPFNGIAFLVGTAVGLTITNKLLAVWQKKQENGGKEA